VARRGCGIWGFDGLDVDLAVGEDGNLRRRERLMFERIERRGSPLSRRDSLIGPKNHILNAILKAGAEAL
jgi:hypothetical protein